MKLLKYFLLSSFLIVVAAGCAEQQSQEQQQTDTMEPATNFTNAVAVVHPTEGSEVTGTVTFEKVGDSVRVQAEIEGLAEGKHGFHIHQYGDCTAPDGTSAGGHYNPTNNNHGASTDENRHVGDMGNLDAVDDETTTLDYVDPMIKLNGANSVIGHAVIIHGGEDDFESQPSGAAGPRMACGVIGIANISSGM